MYQYLFTPPFFFSHSHLSFLGHCLTLLHNQNLLLLLCIINLILATCPYKLISALVTFVTHFLKSMTCSPSRSPYYQPCLSITGGNHFIDNHFTDKYLPALFRIYPFLVVNCQ